MGNIFGGGNGRRIIKLMVEFEIFLFRIRLSDGRFLVYREIGVFKEEVVFKIIIVYGFGSNKDMSFLVF